MPTPCPPNTACKWRRGVQRLMQKHLHVGLILQPLRFSLLSGEGDIAVAEPDRHRTGTGQNGLRFSIEGCPALIRLIRERRFRFNFGFVTHRLSQIAHLCITLESSDLHRRPSRDERVSLVEGESLVYWLRKLVFRGAWLDHRVKEGLLEVAFDDENGEFGYRDPRGGRALLELAPVPSWHELQFRR